MSHPTRTEQIVRIARRHIRRAALHDITLTARDFTLNGDDLLIDGMDPDEWIDAMTMD